jgi:hypothetical protein
MPRKVHKSNGKCLFSVRSEGFSDIQLPRTRLTAFACEGIMHIAIHQFMELRRLIRL